MMNKGVLWSPVTQPVATETAMRPAYNLTLQKVSLQVFIPATPYSSVAYQFNDWESTEQIKNKPAPD